MRRALRRWRHARQRRRMAGPRLLAAFAAAHPRATFVEIGANDARQHDFLAPHLGRGWRGLMVEPVPYVFARLERNLAGTEGVTLVPAAVGERDGRAPFFFLREPAAGERRALPDWYDGIGSFSREVVLRHAPQLPDVAERLVEQEVAVLSFDTLLERHGVEAPDLVVVDAEGHDGRIVRSVDLGRHRPRLLVYEHFHLDGAERDATLRHVGAAGYATLSEGFDTFCLRPGDPALDRCWARLRPVVAAVHKEDE